MHIKQVIVWALIGSAFSFTAYGQDAQSDAPQQAPANPPAKEQQAPRFDVWEYRVQGNTLLERQDVERAVYPYLGRDKTLKDIEAARGALERRYHDAGYATVLVDIPPQDVVDGIVNLRVTEGKLGRLLISGSRYFSLQRIRDELPALAEGEVPYLPTVQEQIARLNQRSGDRAITPVLRPGRTPGTLDVELHVKDELPLHGGIEWNNHNSVNTTRQRLSANLRYDNLWQKEHSLSLQYQTSPQNTSEVQVLSGTYLWRFTGTDDLLVIYGVNSDSDTATVGDMAVIGKGRIAGVRTIVPLAPHDNYFHSFSVGFDYKDFKESLRLQGADSLNTPITYINWSFQYNATQRGAKHTTQFGFGPDFGIRGLVNDPSEFENKRFNSKANYLYLSANLDSTHMFVMNSSLRVRARGQVADSPLISNEQFAAGGAAGVRGYYEAQVLGDDGISYSLEWYTPQFAGKLGPRVQDLRLLVFGDGAKLRVRSPLPANDRPNPAGLALDSLRLRMSTLRCGNY